MTMPARKKAATKAPVLAPEGLTTGSEVFEPMKTLPAGTGPAIPTSEVDPEKHIVINGKVYERVAFGQEQVQAISMVNFADQQITTTQQNLRISQLGRDALVKALLADIEDVPSIGEVSADELPSAA